MKQERIVRMCANHLGLKVRASKDAFKLVERYGKRREIGRYRSVDELQRRIVRYGEWVLRDEEEE